MKKTLSTPKGKVTRTLTDAEIDEGAAFGDLNAQWHVFMRTSDPALLQVDMAALDTVLNSVTGVSQLREVCRTFFRITVYLLHREGLV